MFICWIWLAVPIQALTSPAWMAVMPVFSLVMIWNTTLPMLGAPRK